MYQLPLVFFKCSQDTALCATRVVALTSTSSYQARQTFKQEKKSGTLLNAAGRQKTKTLIYLDNGTVIASPLSIQRLLTSIEKADAKTTDKKNTRMREGIKVTMHERDFEDPNDEELDLEIQEEYEDADYTDEDLLDEDYLDEDDEDIILDLGNEEENDLCE